MYVQSPACIKKFVHVYTPAFKDIYFKFKWQEHIVIFHSFLAHIREILQLLFYVCTKYYERLGKLIVIFGER